MVLAITETGVTVNFEELDEDMEDATVTVVDPDGKTHPVEPQLLLEGMDEATFQFVTALDFVKGGVWFVNGVPFAVAEPDIDEGMAGFVASFQPNNNSEPLAQSNGPGSLMGLGLPGVKVEANGQTVETDANGFFSIEVPAGVYEVTFSKDGYFKVTRDVKVLDDEVSSVIQIMDYFGPEVELKGNAIDSVTDGPVADANVTLEQWLPGLEMWDEIATESTGAEGTFSIKGVPIGGTYRVEVTKDLLQEGYHPSGWIEFTIPPDGIEGPPAVYELDEIFLDAIEPMTLSGKVTAGGVAVDDEDVNLWRADSLDEPLATAQTDANGDYIFEGYTFSSGTYIVQVDDETNAKYFAAIEVEEGVDKVHNIALVEGVDFDFTVQPSEAGEEFMDDDYKAELLVFGLPLIEAESYDISTDPANKMTFDFERVAPGDYPIVVSGTYVITTEYNINVAADAITIQDVPEASAFIELAGAVDVVPNGSDPAMLLQLVDADTDEVVETFMGDEYTFEGVPEGEYYVVAIAPGFYPYESDVFEVEKNETEVVTYDLKEIDTTLTGFVRTEGTGAPIAGARVAFYAVAGVEDFAPGQLVDSETTDFDGSYDTDLGPGVYDVVIRAEGHETKAAGRVTITEGDELKQNYRLEAGGDAKLVVNVKDEDGDWVSVSDIILADEYVADFEGNEPLRGMWKTDGNQATFEPISGGKYTVTVEDDAYVDQSVEVEVAKGKTKVIDVVLVDVADTNEIKFRVIDEELSDVYEAVVALYTAEGKKVDCKFAGAGNYFDELVDGEYMLKVFIDTYVWDEGNFVLQEGLPTWAGGYAVKTVPVTVDGDDVVVPPITVETRWWSPIETP